MKTYSHSLLFISKIALVGAFAQLDDHSPLNVEQVQLAVHILRRIHQMLILSLELNAHWADVLKTTLEIIIDF